MNGKKINSNCSVNVIYQDWEPKKDDKARWKSKVFKYSELDLNKKYQIDEFKNPPTISSMYISFHEPENIKEKSAKGYACHMPSTQANMDVYIRKSDVSCKSLKIYSWKDPNRNRKRTMSISFTIKGTVKKSTSKEIKIPK